MSEDVNNRGGSNMYRSERRVKPKTKTKPKPKPGLTLGKISDKEKKESIYAGPEALMLKTKKAQTLATSADKPKEIIQSKKMSTGSASQLSKQSKLRNLMDKAVYAANKFKKK